MRVKTETKKYKIGYTSGVYDLFHIGHLNILKNAKKYCDYLIVAVSTDELVEKAKGKKPWIPFEERVEILKSIRYVDKVIPQYDYNDKLTPALENKVDVMFVGSDWKGTEKWNKIEADLNMHSIDLIYLPHTNGTSSTILKEKIGK